MTTRVELMMALHHACTPLPYPEINPHVREVYARWLRKGYIVIADENDKRQYGSQYIATDALRVWTEALLEVPEPVQVTRWEVPLS